MARQTKSSSKRRASTGQTREGSRKHHRSGDSREKRGVNRHSSRAEQTEPLYNNMLEHSEDVANVHPHGVHNRENRVVEDDISEIGESVTGNILDPRRAETAAARELSGNGSMRSGSGGDHGASKFQYGDGEVEKGRVIDEERGIARVVNSVVFKQVKKLVDVSGIDWDEPIAKVFYNGLNMKHKPDAYKKAWWEQNKRTVKKCINVKRNNASTSMRTKFFGKQLRVGWWLC